MFLPFLYWEDIEITTINKHFIIIHYNYGEKLKATIYYSRRFQVLLLHQKETWKLNHPQINDVYFLKKGSFKLRSNDLELW